MYRLILIDDEEIVLRSIQKVFQLADFNFELAGAFTNPKKALEQLPQLAPHLIITDIKMTSMDGLTFSTRAKEIFPEVLIVILSGYDDFAFAQTAVKIGISDYLLKPIKKRDFADMLKNMENKIAAMQHLPLENNISLSRPLSAAATYIEQHFNENISLSDVADHIYISKNYLCDLFKKELNLTFIDYLTNIRIEKAKFYLSHTDMKMYEISNAVGYHDYAYFSQIFKRQTGTTLSDYRKQH